MVFVRQICSGVAACVRRGTGRGLSEPHARVWRVGMVGLGREMSRERAQAVGLPVRLTHSLTFCVLCCAGGFWARASRFSSARAVGQFGHRSGSGRCVPRRMCMAYAKRCQPWYAHVLMRLRRRVVSRCARRQLTFGRPL